MADEWPLRDFIEFGALPGAVPYARLHARLLLDAYATPRPGGKIVRAICAIEQSADSQTQANQIPR